jgi:four helix bundle protein
LAPARVYRPTELRCAEELQRADRLAETFELCKRIYHVTSRFPAAERFGLTAQLRRCAVSVPSNIAEGYGRGTTRDYVRFLWQANGSICEMETQLRLARELEFGNAEALGAALGLLGDVERLLAALTRSLEAKDGKQCPNGVVPANAGHYADCRLQEPRCERPFPVRRPLGPSAPWPLGPYLPMVRRCLSPPSSC